MEQVFSILQQDRDSELDELIKKRPQLINWTDQQGMTLLHRAAQMNKAGCSLVLLYRGADPFAMVPDIEWTPLHCAAQRDSTTVVQAYLGLD